MSASVLVTGATGFLGRNILAALAEALPEVRPVALVRDRAVHQRERFDLRVDAVEGRLEDADRWAADPALARCVGIIHATALVKHSRAEAAPVFRANVGGTQEMVRLAARLGCRLVAVSTSGTVGCSSDPDAAPDEEAPFADNTVAGWPYYASKVAAERTARALAGVLDVELVVLRPPVLYHLPGWNGTLAEFARLVADTEGRRIRPLRVPVRAAHLAAQLFHPFGGFVDPVLVEMACHHWNFRTRWSAKDLDYRSREPQATLRDTLRSIQPRGRAA